MITVSAARNPVFLGGGREVVDVHFGQHEVVLEVGNGVGLAENVAFHFAARMTPVGAEEDQHQAVRLAGRAAGGVETGLPDLRLLGDTPEGTSKTATSVQSSLFFVRILPNLAQVETIGDVLLVIGKRGNEVALKSTACGVFADSRR